MTTKERRKHQIHPSCRGHPRYPEIPMSLGTGNRHAILVISPPFILLFSHSPSVWWWKNLGKTRKKWYPIFAKKNLACSIHEITSQRRCTWRRHLPGRAHRQSPSPGEDRSPPSSAASAPAQSLGPKEKKMQFLWENHGEMVISLGANADLTGDNGDLTRKKCGSAREKFDSTRKKMWFNKGKWWFN